MMEDLSDKQEFIEIHGELAEFKSVINEDIGMILTEIRQAKRDIIRWNFIFCVTQFAATVTVLTLFLKNNI